MRRLGKGFNSTKTWLLPGVVIAILVVWLLVNISRMESKMPLETTTLSPRPVEAPPVSPPQSPQPSTDMVVHKDIIATVFWVGETASADNNYIQNKSSTWQEDWMGFYGGEDKPDDRCGYMPCAFTPKENPFYFALPFNDYHKNGEPKSASILKKIPWYTGQPQAGMSLVKNRWIEITHGDIKAYAQWEDAGPFGESDADYVLGTSRPKVSRAGIDLSPATADYLRIDGRGTVNWKFVEEAQVPAGPWKKTITASGIQY